MVHRGRAPDAIGSLDVLVRVDNAKAALEYFLERNGGKPSSMISNIAHVLVLIATAGGRGDQATIDKLKRYRKQLASSGDAEAEARKEAGVGIGLADDLRAIRTAIVKSQLACDFEAAFDLLLFQLARSVFTSGYHDDALDIRECARRGHGRGPRRGHRLDAAGLPRLRYRHRR